MKQRKIKIVFIALVCLWFLVPIFARAQNPENKEIVLGMSTALTGPAENLGKDMLSGVLLGFERVNREGGVNGRKIRVIAYDDGYEPRRTTINMQKLINEDEVLAVIGNVGTPTAIAAIPIVNAETTLLFAPFTGAGVLRKNPPDRYVINIRASYEEETSAMVDALIDVYGLSVDEIGFFTQRDGYGDAGFSGGIKALIRHGLNSDLRVVHTRYERNTLAVENAVSDILLMENAPKAIIMVGAYAPCAKFIRLLKENGLEPIFLNVSFVGSHSLAEMLGDLGDGVIVTQVVPHYNADLPIAREYLKDLESSGTKDSPSFVGLEGYIASRTFILALESLKEEPGRENIIDAIEGLGEFDLGTGSPLRLGKEDHQASHKIWPTVIKGGKAESLDWDSNMQK